MAKLTNEELQKSPELSKLKGANTISSIDTFCANEMVGYGREVCSHRAIPSYIDGLKLHQTRRDLEKQKEFSFLYRWLKRINQKSIMVC